MKDNKKWQVGWGVTSKCNMYCSFCYSKGVRKKEYDLMLSDWKKFIDKNHNKIDSINYGTGENTLLAEWYELIYYIRRSYPDIKQALTTNGYLSEAIEKVPKFKRIVDESIDEIDVSLDFGDERKHCQFRGNNLAFKWALDTLEYCIKAHKKRTIVILGIEATLKISNLDHLFNIAKRTQSFVRINLYRPVNRKMGLNPPGFNVVLKVLEFINNNHAILSLSDPLFSSIFTPNETKPDPSGINSIRIIPDGYICPSTYLISEEFRTSNIKDEFPFRDAYSSEVFQRIRENKFPEDCNNCSVKETCRGGVIDRRYLWYGTLNERDPYCPYRYFDDVNLPMRNFKVKKDLDFSSIHDGYLPTMFFSAK